MNLVAAMMVARVEPDRYLEECVAHLLEFCDGIVLLLDGPLSAWPRDVHGPYGWPPIVAVARYGGSFFEHEGRARQMLIAHALDCSPTHVLSIDADEFVADGAAIRAACTDDGIAVWHACMQEVWEAGPGSLMIRQDGGWEEHDVPVLWKPQELAGPPLMADRALACGRVPQAATGAPSGCTGTSVLHFGWTNRDEREARHARYAEHDGGRFHASHHLDSILWPDQLVALTSRPWPAGWTNRRVTSILDHAATTA